MKNTVNNKLAFRSEIVSELNADSLRGIDSGLPTTLQSTVALSEITRLIEQTGVTY